jgi:hypothetical protein
LQDVRLANEKGKIDWQEPVDVRGEDFDAAIDIDVGYVSLNASSLNPSLNSSARVTVKVDGCDEWVIYYLNRTVVDYHDLRTNGRMVGTREDGCWEYCSDVVCDNRAGTLSYTVQHFDGTGGYGYGGIIPVPEFGTWAMVLALAGVVAGMIIVRRRD